MTVTLNKALGYLVFLFLGLLLMFNRPFVGIYILNIQIGKYLIAASVLLSGLALLFFIFKKDIYSPLIINNLLKIFFLSNLIFLSDARIVPAKQSAWSSSLKIFFSVSSLTSGTECTM